MHNPVAGIHSADKVEKLIRQKLQVLQWEYEFYQTRSGEPVVEVVTKARAFGFRSTFGNQKSSSPIPSDPFDVFVAAGGDGTVSAVASALAWSGIPLLIIPCGTGNGLARDLKLPLKLEKAADLLDHPDHVHAVDGIKIGERLYLLNVSAGLTPAALKLTDRREKQRFGRLAYIFAGFRALLGIQPVTFQLKIDGKQHEIRASEMILMNSISLGSTGRFLELGIENDDGVMDLIIIQSRTVLDYLRVFWNFLLRRPQTDPDVKRFPVYSSLTIDASQSLEVQADGDLIGYTPLHIEVCPQAIMMIVPLEADDINEG